MDQTKTAEGASFGMKIRWGTLLSGLVMSVLWTRFAHAQNTWQNAVQAASEARSNVFAALRPTSPTTPIVSGFLKFETLQYPTTVPGQENLGQNNMMEAGLKFDGRSSVEPRLSGAADMNLGRSLNLNYSYVGVFELSSTYQFSPQLSMTLGRARQDWSSADESWDLGIWQPTFSMDSLRIQQQGLTGLFFSADSAFVQATAFYSPVFIPTTTPEIADRNGEITSESRWFRSIPTSSQLFGKDTQLYFRLSIPDLREIVSQQGGGGQIRLGRKDAGFWTRVSYANKAMNSLFFKYDAALRSGAQGSRGEIELSPIVHRHEVAGADIGFQYETGAVTVSYVEDRARLTDVTNKKNSDGLMTDFIQQSPSGIQAASFRWDQRLRIPWTGIPVAARFDYLKAKTEATRDFDSAGIEQSSLLPHRLQFTNAASIQGQARVSERWTSKLKYLRDFDQRGSLWNAEMEYRSASQWATAFGIDILGTDDTSVGNPDTRFLNYYRQNDRIYGGLSYVF